tara:strand:- start:146 stop:295 length:150 start_codon:yes stop_codon:yes gene_type:complete
MEKERGITIINVDETKQCDIHVVSGSYSEKQVDEAYDKGFKDAMIKYRT